MTHHVPDDEDPRLIREMEMARLLPTQRKRDQARGLAAAIRATRIENGLDELIRKALGAHPQ
jgi:hypothetical protein